MSTILPSDYVAIDVRLKPMNMSISLPSSANILQLDSFVNLKGIVTFWLNFKDTEIHLNYQTYSASKNQTNPLSILVIVLFVTILYAICLLAACKNANTKFAYAYAFRLISVIPG